MFKPEGVHVAFMTPFKDGTFNEPVVRKMVDFAVEKGVNGIFPLSSIGEFLHFDFEEKVRMMEVVYEQARKRVAVMPGVTASRPEDSIRLAKKAREIGCDAVVAAPPYYYPQTPGRVEHYFEMLSEAVDIPIVLYNIPMCTTSISCEATARLSKRKNFVAIKDSSGSMVAFSHFIDEVTAAGGDMSFLVGREELLLPSLAVGGNGCLCAAAGILPEVIVLLYKSWQKKDYEKAKDLHLSLVRLVRAMSAAPFPLGYKAALEFRGFDMGPIQQPFPEEEQEAYARTKERVRDLLQSILSKAGVSLAA